MSPTVTGLPRTGNAVSVMPGQSEFGLLKKRSWPITLVAFLAAGSEVPAARPGGDYFGGLDFPGDESAGQVDDTAGVAASSE
jgi:hypothetical protein